MSEEKLPEPRSLFGLVTKKAMREYKDACLEAAMMDEVWKDTMLNQMVLNGKEANMQIEGGVSRFIAAAFADQFRNSGAINYLELSFQSGDLGLIVTLQKRDGKTPHQFRQEAEDALKAIQDKP